MDDSGSPDAIHEEVAPEALRSVQSSEPHSEAVVTTTSLGVGGLESASPVAVPGFVGLDESPTSHAEPSRVFESSESVIEDTDVMEAMAVSAAALEEPQPPKSESSAAAAYPPNTPALGDPVVLPAAAAAGNPVHDVFVKLLLIGNSGVGKSSMLLRFADNAFNETYINTIGIDFKTRLVDMDSKRIKLQIWDTAGQERFQSLQTLYYRGANGIVLVYDICDAKSFSSIQMWMAAIKQHASPDVAVMLVGNKADRASQRQVSVDEGAAIAEQFGIRFVEVSAKAGSGVQDAFMRITADIMARNEKTVTEAAAPPPKRTPTISIVTEKQKVKKKKKCC